MYSFSLFRSAHYRSEWHRYNVKRRCADMPPISYTLFHEKLAVIKGRKEQEAAEASKQWVCEYTKRTFKTEAAYQHYLTTSAYKKAVEKHNAKLEREKSESKSGGNKKKVVPEKYRASVEDEEEEEEEEEGGDDDEAEEGEGDEEGNFGEPGFKPIPLKHSLFSNVGEFTTVKASLNYMLKQHGFFLPFVDYLVDLEGLLEYLGAKIGYGHVCIYCNKQFKSTQAVQQHMREKGHCMINLQTRDGKEDEDLMEFWHFGKSAFDSDDEEDEEEEGEEEEEGKRTRRGAEGEEDEDEDEDMIAPVKLTKEERRLLLEQQRARTLELLGKKVDDDLLNKILNQGGKSDEGEDGEGERRLTLLTELRQGNRQLKEINEAGELVLNDGTIIGHRDYRLIYKQKLKPNRGDNGSSSKGTIINGNLTNLDKRKLAGTYYAIGMPGYHAATRVAAKEKTKQANKIHRKWMDHYVRNGMNNNVLIRKWFRHQCPL